MVRILKRACCLIITVLAVMLLCTNSSSAKVHNGTFEGNTRWYYDTRTKTVTIRPLQSMVTVFVRVS